MRRSSINATRSEALFASDIQPSQHPTRAEVNLAITDMLRMIGSQGCAARVAQEFGDHPENATRRMRWAREAAGLSEAAANTRSPKMHAPEKKPVSSRRRRQVTKVLLA